MCHRQRVHQWVERAEARDPNLRASDAEREATVRLLRDHGAAGRLDVEELEQRLEAAYAAGTGAELDALLRDLPGNRPAPVAMGPHARPLREEWGVFLVVAVTLVVIWALSGAGYFWPLWVIGFWGGALVAKSAFRPRSGRVAHRV
jgi:hypothetical protein